MATKLLIIDEDPGTKALLSQDGQQNEFDVITAEDGLTGLHKARAERPNLIILDVMLSKLDGFKISRFLKFDEMYKNIPIIMLSATSDPKEERMAKDVGADVLLTKPLSGEELLATIKQLIGQYA